MQTLQKTMVFLDVHLSLPFMLYLNKGQTQKHSWPEEFIILFSWGIGWKGYILCPSGYFVSLNAYIAREQSRWHIWRDAVWLSGTAWHGGSVAAVSPWSLPTDLCNGLCWDFCNQQKRPWCLQHWPSLGLHHPQGREAPALNEFSSNYCSIP